VGKGPPDSGGIAAFVEMLLATDAARSRDARFLNVAHGESRQGGRLAAGNVRRTIADARALWRAAGDRDIVHIHSALAPFVTMVRAGVLALVARARGCRVVIHAHGGRVQLWLTGPVRRLLARLALAGADRIVAVSEGGRDALARALGPDRVVLVDNGVDPEVFRPGDGSFDPPRILYVGLLTPRKGVLDLFGACDLLRDRGIDHELWAVGGAPDEGPAAEAEVRAAAGPQVQLLGTRSHEEMPAMYRQADVFCLPSWWEAMPLSVLEAMASGLPVVATTVGDVARIVDDGVTALLVPPRNPERLADALAALLCDPARRRSMGEAGRRRVTSSFTVTATGKAMDVIYSALEARPR
jgi:glycosyltransferase involved in cell wall biosynthesis